MTLLWNILRPQDKYQVWLSSELSMYEMKLLAQLYQPILGAQAYALYMTLYSEVEGEQLSSLEKSHQWLLNLMGIPLDQIYQARLRLEGLGLLRTFLTKREVGELFTYQLFPPLSAEQFFLEDILSICLYNQIGAHRYKELRARYIALENVQETINKEELTKEFHEVFTSIHPSELEMKAGSEKEDDLQLLAKPLPAFSAVDQSSSSQLQFERYPLDVEALKAFFMKGIQAKTILSPKNMREIKKIAFFYQIDTWSLSRIIQDSLTLEDELELPLFRERAKEWYRMQQGGQPPQIRHMTQPVAQRIFHEQEPVTEEEKHLAKLEELSPLQLLEAYQGGGKVAEADLKLVEELIFDYQLYPAVANLLLEYILLTNEFKLPRNLVTKVAAHWKRLGIKDVKEAQNLARKEHLQYKGWQESKKNDPVQKRTSNRSTAKGTERKDIMPEWIVDPSKSDPALQGKNQSTLTDEEKLKRTEQLLASLNKDKEKGGQ